MSKIYLRFAAILVAVGLLASCGAGGEDSAQTNNQSEETTTSETKSEQKEEKVIITISMDNGSEYINEKKIAIEEGTTLMKVMKENFHLETDFNGGFITSIDGVAPKEGEKKAWMFKVNGEMPNVGAKEYKLSPGDKVTFDLHAY